MSVYYASAVLKLAPAFHSSLPLPDLIISYSAPQWSQSPLLPIPVLPFIAGAPVVHVVEVGGTVPVRSTNTNSYTAATGSRDSSCWGKS